MGGWRLTSPAGSGLARAGELCLEDPNGEMIERWKEDAEKSREQVIKNYVEFIRQRTSFEDEEGLKEIDLRAREMIELCGTFSRIAESFGRKCVLKAGGGL